jgi:hypothetical protein
MDSDQENKADENSVRGLADRISLDFATIMTFWVTVYEIPIVECIPSHHAREQRSLSQLHHRHWSVVKAYAHWQKDKFIETGEMDLPNL